MRHRPIAAFLLRPVGQWRLLFPSANHGLAPLRRWALCVLPSANRVLPSRPLGQSRSAFPSSQPIASLPGPLLPPTGRPRRGPHVRQEKGEKRRNLPQGERGVWAQIGAFRGKSFGGARKELIWVEFWVKSGGFCSVFGGVFSEGGFPPRRGSRSGWNLGFSRGIPWAFWADFGDF